MAIISSKGRPLLHQCPSLEKCAGYDLLKAAGCDTSSFPHDSVSLIKLSGPNTVLHPLMFHKATSVQKA